MKAMRDTIRAIRQNNGSFSSISRSTKIPKQRLKEIMWGERATEAEVTAFLEAHDLNLADHSWKEEFSSYELESLYGARLFHLETSESSFWRSQPVHYRKLLGKLFDVFLEIAENTEIILQTFQRDERGGIS